MKTPWHIWVVGGVTLLWHAGGGYDYLMAQSRNANYLDLVPEAMRADFVAYLDGMPVWATSAWAFGVWGAVAGSALILARSRHAVVAFALSMLGVLGNFTYTYALAPTAVSAMAGTGALLFSLAIVLVLLGTAGYALRQRAAGVLR